MTDFAFTGSFRHILNEKDKIWVIVLSLSLLTSTSQVSITKRIHSVEVIFGNLDTRQTNILPEHNSIANCFEEVISIWVHGYNVSAIGIIFQSFVYPVNESIFFFL